MIYRWLNGLFPNVMKEMGGFVREVRKHAFGKDNVKDGNFHFLHFNENDPHFPDSILDVEFPEKFRNKEMENEDEEEKMVESALEHCKVMEKDLKDLKKVVKKRSSQANCCAKLADSELDGAIREKVAAVSGFLAQLDTEPAAKKRLVLQHLVQAVDVLKNSFSSCCHKNLLLTTYVKMHLCISVCICIHMHSVHRVHLIWLYICVMMHYGVDARDA